MASTGTISDFAANQFLDAALADGTFTEPTAVYLALSTTAIATTDNSGAAVEPDEATPAWTNYEREQLLAASLNAAASRSKDNSAEIDFDTAMTGGTVACTHWYVTESLAGDTDNNWFLGTLDGTINVEDGNPVKVPIGSLIFAVDATFATVP